MIGNEDFDAVKEQVAIWKRVSSLEGFGTELSLRIAKACKNIEGMNKLLRGQIVVKGIGENKMRKLEKEFNNQ